MISWEGRLWGIEQKAREERRGSGGIEGGRLNRGFVGAPPMGW
jgi:hypothetical protein